MNDTFELWIDFNGVMDAWQSNENTNQYSAEIRRQGIFSTALPNEPLRVMVLWCGLTEQKREKSPINDAFVDAGQLGA